MADLEIQITLVNDEKITLEQTGVLSIKKTTIDKIMATGESRVISFGDIIIPWNQIRHIRVENVGNST